MFNLSLLPLVLAVFPPSSAHGCDEINEANKSLQNRLEVQEDMQKRLDDQLKTENARCLGVQSKISAQTAKIAGAQSCVALRETAAFNRELKQKSHECAEKADGVRFAMEFLHDTQFSPFMTSIDLIVQQDQGDSFLQRHCGGHLQDTAGVLDRTKGLLGRSTKGIAKAKADTESYAVLEAQVAGFEQVTQGGYDRCVAEGKILNSQPSANGAPVPVVVPQGHSETPASDITGTDQERAKKARELEILGF